MIEHSPRSCSADYNWACGPPVGVSIQGILHNIVCNINYMGGPDG